MSKISRSQLEKITLEDFTKNTEENLVNVFTDYYFRPMLTVKDSKRNLAFAEALQASSIIEQYYYEKSGYESNNIVVIIDKQKVIDFIIARDIKDNRLEQEYISMLDVEPYMQISEEFDQNPLKKLFNELYNINDTSYNYSAGDKEYKYIQ